MYGIARSVDVSVSLARRCTGTTLVDTTSVIAAELAMMVDELITF
jgi:hypothetical protein